GSAGRDVEDLLPRLELRAEELAREATEKLKKRGELEEGELRQTLENQRERVKRELERRDKDFKQSTFDFGDEERRPLESDMKHGRIRLGQFDRDLETEPKRIRDFYDVRVKRIEPVGVIYLWPETN